MEHLCRGEAVSGPPELSGTFFHSGKTFVESIKGEAAERDVAPCYFALTKITPIGYKQHVKAADATIAIEGGRRISDNVYSLRNYAVKIKKPCLVVQLDGLLKDRDPVGRISSWIKKNDFKTINFAVSREIWKGESPRGKSAEADSWEPAIFLILEISDALDDFCNLTQVSRIYRTFTPRKRISTGRLYRHGDLLIRQITRLPKYLRPLREPVLAYGEETGHSHELHPINGSNIQVYENRKGVRYFRTDNARLTHQEHAAITIEKGFYSVRVEREYDYFREEITLSDD